MIEDVREEPQRSSPADSDAAIVPEPAALLLDAAHEGCLLLDHAARCTYLNPAAATLLGERREDFVGRPLWSVLPELTESPFASACRQALAGGDAATCEVALPPDQRRLTVALHPFAGGVALQLRADAPAQQR